MTKISYGKAKLSDSLRISVLLKTVYIQTYAVGGVTFEFSNFITKRFAPELIEKTIKEDPSRLIIAYQNENPIGVAEIIFDSTCPIRNISIPELSKLYVLERFYGKGIGLGLLNSVESQLINNGFKELNLEVWKQNERAIAFYKKHRFISIGNADFPMEYNTYENFVMNKELN